MAAILPERKTALGVVWKVRQVFPVEREVAFKIIRQGVGAAELIERFDSERRSLVRMSHDGIARVYEAEETESGHPYFVMELVDGIPFENAIGLSERVWRVPRRMGGPSRGWLSHCLRQHHRRCAITKRLRSHDEPRHAHRGIGRVRLHNCQEWMREAGFKETRIEHLVGPDSMVVENK